VVCVWGVVTTRVTLGCVVTTRVTVGCAAGVVHAAEEAEMEAAFLAALEALNLLQSP
jgi:hypothetical protein